MEVIRLDAKFAEYLDSTMTFEIKMGLGRYRGCREKHSGIMVGVLHAGYHMNKLNREEFEALHNELWDIFNNAH